MTSRDAILLKFYNVDSIPTPSGRFFPACFHWRLKLVSMQVVYEVNVKGVDERRLVGAQLQKLAEGEAGSSSYLIFCIFVVYVLRMKWKVCYVMAICDS